MKSPANNRLAELIMKQQGWEDELQSEEAPLAQGGFGAVVEAGTPDPTTPIPEPTPLSGPELPEFQEAGLGRYEDWREAVRGNVPYMMPETEAQALQELGFRQRYHGPEGAVPFIEHFNLKYGGTSPTHQDALAGIETDHLGQRATNQADLDFNQSEREGELELAQLLRQANLYKQNPQIGEMLETQGRAAPEVFAAEHDRLADTYEADKGLEGSRYVADQGLEGLKIGADADRDTSWLSQGYDFRTGEPLPFTNQKVFGARQAGIDPASGKPLYTDPKTGSALTKAALESLIDERGLRYTQAGNIVTSILADMENTNEAAYFAENPGAAAAYLQALESLGVTSPQLESLVNQQWTQP